MADSKPVKVLSSINRPTSESPPPNCAICLGTFTNKCFSNSCMHQFCFKCLLEWSKIKPECPLCKQPFKKIIHNVKSNTEYDEHIVNIPPRPEEVHIIDNEEFLYLALGGHPSTRHHFHFRTTFTVDSHGEHAIQQMLLTHPLMGSQVSIGGIPRNEYFRRRRDITSTTFRRSIYLRDLWVNATPDVTGRFREVSPTYFRDYPGARTRLVPWLNRELNALLYENTQLVMHVVDIILEQLMRVHICSRPFRQMLGEYLDSKTDHFIHEFYHFMRSPYDMIGYDRNIVYTERPRSPLPYVVNVEDNDSSDSDVILVGTVGLQEPIVIDLVNTDSDEPILVSHTQNPLPQAERSSGTSESRPPVLPPKLRLKHNRQSREKEKTLKKRKRRHKSRSRSSSSSSLSDSTTSSEASRKKRSGKKRKRPARQRVYTDSSSSCSNVNVDSASSDSDVPLSTLAGKKRQLQKFKRTFKNLFEAPREETVTNETAASTVDVHLPGCSRYNSDSSSVGLDLRTSIKEENGLDLRTNDNGGNHHHHRRENENLPGPSSSRQGLNSRSATSRPADVENDAEERSSNQPTRSNQSRESQNAERSRNRRRLWNICIKKEETTNRWYAYPSNYDSDSSSD